MSKLEEQFLEDRALRDSARAVLLADIEHARTSLTPKAVSERVTGRIGDGAKDVLEVAKTQADDNRGIIAILIGAVLLWLARGPILEILGLDPESEGFDAPLSDDSSFAANAEPEREAETELNTSTEPQAPVPGDEDEQ